MTPAEIKAAIAEENPDALFADGWDDALIGSVHRFGSEVLALYDTEKIISKLMDDGLDRDEAWEHFNFNIIGAWVGDGTPAFALLTEGYGDAD